MKMRLGQMLFSLIGVAALACSGRYEVGAMGDDLPSQDGEAESLGRAGSGGGGGGSAGAEMGTECDNYPSDPPRIWVAPFAEPAVIWERISLMVHGEVLAPPSTLPAVATSEWAGSIAVQAFNNSTQLPAGAPLVRRYLTHALRLDENSALPDVWSPRISGDVTVLDVLYAMPLGQQGRVGILSEPAWLALHPRIVSRGVTILGGVLNTPVPLPPPSVPTLDSDPSAAQGRTERQRIAQHRTDPSCAGCHSMIDPFGFALSHFDEVGVYQTSENGLAIDSSGTVMLRSDLQPVQFSSIEDLGPQIAQSCTARLAFADLNLTLALIAAGKLMQHEPIPDVWLPDRDRVRWAFVAGKSYPALVSAMAQTNPILR
ncbi:MAG TPA: DUF1588 domain-containing protein [Polyangiaceae bacterium]|nr:DUF1588 domain-containing protein [Polyangiaceae bacterium]